jgi:nucleoside-diphosphate-sugar epimerase
VFGLRRSSVVDDSLRTAGIVPLHADISRAETLAPLPPDFDWVVNCSATGGGSVADYRSLYLQGTQNLIAWLAPGFAHCPKARFLYTSSTGVYGQNDGSLVDESSPAQPSSETARVLVEAEQALLVAAREQGFPAIILRAAGIYGPGRGYLLKQFLAGDARIEGEGGRILNMIHRDDLIRAIIAALERGQLGEIYNVTDDEPVSQLAFFSWLAEKLGRPLPPFATAPSDLSRRRGLTSKRISNRKLRSELGVSLGFPTFREGYSAGIATLANA